MSSNSVHFYGIDSVLEAARNRDCPRWGIFQRQQFLFKYESGDMAASLQHLDDVLSSIAQGESVYTLKFFEEDIKIKENTKCDGSFNFKLVDQEVAQFRQSREMIRGPHTRNDMLEKIMERLDAIEGKTAIDDEDAEPQTLQGAIIGVLKDPTKLDGVIATIHAIKNLFTPGSEPRQLSIGQVNTFTAQGQNTAAGPGAGAGSSANVSPMADENEAVIRLGIAIDTLQRNDPDILLHLEKLAKVASEDPGKFKSLISMLSLL